MILDGCPPGNFVFINSDGDTATCDPFNPENAPCPGGSTCQWSTANQRYQCCGSNPAPQSVRVNDGCPNAQIAYRDKRTKVRVCTAGSSTCPPGYFCQFSSLNRQFQCCGVSGGCPNDSVAFVGSFGEPEKCVVGHSKCPVGFACQRSVGGHHICCATNECTRPCGGFLVLVTRLIGGRLEERCERSCPYEEIEIGGVCYGMGIRS
uniref:EB domain-containing protein n=1 Tax=Haemonchus contortus TaxID=6289 RepID=W6NDS2_HAECO